MKRLSLLLILLNLLGFLTWFNWNIASKERTLRHGQLVLLELVPVDPRSLMQGDYMRLNYAITARQSPHRLPKRGYCVVRLDQHQVAKAVRFQQGEQPLNDGEYLIRYFYNNYFINLGAESFFFQEGKQDRYALAKYGGLRVDNEGNSVLSGLYDVNFKLIE
ncbi:GDYXXLXY domain-containing protein [Arcticibacter sp. MXS-1]|uniref:GDYXXLXY domain-containing protein n=1 Tax=Arcticibacter sp. MXS-1 TaxID=3341726 RepID=UPI0035A91DFF